MHSHNLLLLPLLLLLPKNVLGQANQSLANTTQAFQEAHIVPDVLSSFDPKALLELEFTDPSTKQTVNVTPGIVLTMEQTMQEPQFFLTANTTIPSNISYVLTIVDPDAPTPQNTSISQFRHLLGGNFHVDNSSKLVNMSAALSDFVNPTPPAGSDPHRYVALVYIQPDGFDSAASALVNASTPRNNFNLTIFGEAVHLGSPIAGTYFLTGPSNSTPSSTSSGSAGASSTSSASPSSTSPAASNSASRSVENLMKVTWGVTLCAVVSMLVM